MMVPNRARGEVPLPEAGEGVYLILTMDGMERLEGAYGETYLSAVIENVNALSPRYIKTALSVMMKGGDIDDTPFGLTLDELKTRILDAISLAVSGKVFTDAQSDARESAIKEAEADFKKKQERVKEDPSLAPLYLNDLLSKLVLSGDAEAALGLKKFEDSPSPTSADTQEDSSES